MSGELPIVLVLRTPGTDSGAVDTEVYCVNVTEKACHVAVSSTGFTTIDDEGTLLHHGSAPVQLTLDPGEAAKIADVVAWEWDGHVGLLIAFTDPETGAGCRATYNLRHRVAHSPQPARGFAAKGGYVTPPGYVTEVAAGDS